MPGVVNPGTTMLLMRKASILYQDKCRDTGTNLANGMNTKKKGTNKVYRTNAKNKLKISQMGLTLRKRYQPNTGMISTILADSINSENRYRPHTGTRPSEQNMT